MGWVEEWSLQNFLFLPHNRYIGSSAIGVYIKNPVFDWTQVQTIYPPRSESRENDGFGFKIATDGETLLVAWNAISNRYRGEHENFLFFYKLIDGKAVLEQTVEAGINRYICQCRH